MMLPITQPVIDAAERHRKADDRNEYPRRFIACTCPVALALRAAGYANAVVAATKWMNGGREYALPAEAQAFVADFHDGRPVAPAVLDVEGPCDRRPAPVPTPSVAATATTEALNNDR